MSEPKIVVVVPSLHPDPSLVEFVRTLLDCGVPEVIVVDDGSGAAYARVFERICELPGVTVLGHAVNEGKGSALKLAFAHILEQGSAEIVVTADSDGQHSPGAVLRVAGALADPVEGTRLAVLGVRDFDLPDLPLRSRLGNKITTLAVRALYGQSLPDTQTGLRAFSRALLPDLIEVRGNRFEYEMNALTWMLTHRIPLAQVPIETIYHDDTNSQSHFRPVRDSIMIYSQLGGFVLSSALGALIDLAAFATIIDGLFDGQDTLRAVAVSAVGARALSTAVNYLVNKHLIFDPGRRSRHSVWRYYALALAILGTSAVTTTVLSNLLGGHVVWAKIVVDATLFLVSFVVQKRWVFRMPARPTRSG